MIIGILSNLLYFIIGVLIGTFISFMLVIILEKRKIKNRGTRNGHKIILSIW